MKKLFYLIFTAIIILTFNANITKAQETANPSIQTYTTELQAHVNTRWMSKYLNLDEAQSIEFYNISLKYLKQKDTLKLITNEMVDKKEILLQISNNTQTELQTILSPEQYIKYTSFFENARNKTLIN